MTPLSFPLLKTWSALTRGLLLLALALWLLLAASWGVLHWWIVPRIGEFRPQLQARASQALGVAVRLQGISAQSSGLMPSFELTGVELLDEQGRLALHLPRVRVALSPRSVWRLGFEQLHIDSPELDIRRARDGRLSVAGLVLSGAGATNQDALNWFFSQTELVIEHGTLRWTDELRGAAPLALQQVNAVVRNRGRHHDLRLDATPEPLWGQRFSLQGQFLQPLLSRQAGRWQDWEGQGFAQFAEVDVSALRHYADLGVDLRQGRGALRAWVDVSQGRVTGATADLALSAVSVQLGPTLQPLALQQVQGRVAGRLLAGGFELETRGLVFDTAQGLHWPGGQVRLRSQVAEGRRPAQGELQADQLDLAALVQIADRLPLQAALRQQLQRYAPQGRIESLNASWQGPATALAKYKVNARVRQLALAAVAPVPGIQGLDLDLVLDERSGRALVALKNGHVDVPGFFEDSLIPVDQLDAEASWRIDGEQLSVELANMRFSNADAQGQARIQWRTSDPAKAASGSRFPGVLDLQASLSRADGRRVHRYLPLVIDPLARDYVRQAVLAGSASNVQFQIKGDLADMPNADPAKGTFKISADVRDARLAYVPRSLQPPGELPWPELNGLSGQLVIDRFGLQVNNARARLGDAGALQVTQVQASIADLLHTQVQVSARLSGPLKDALRVVNASPVAALTEGALARSTASGPADYALQLALPIDNLAASTVQGSVILGGNELQITPETPRLSKVRGTVNYSHTGLSLAGVQARLLGGDARLDGGWVLTPGAPPSTIRINGTASAEGLRAATELGFVARLAQRTSGSAPYSASLDWRRGGVELQFSSSLQGLASTLPAPLQKDAVSRLPLRYQTTWLDSAGGAGGGQERVSVTLEGLAQVVYEQDVSGPEPRVLRGLVALGADNLGAPALPAQGVAARISLAQLPLDDWQALLTQLTGAPQGVLALGEAVGANPYVPTTLALNAGRLSFGAREFNQLQLDLRRDGSAWRGEVQAAELKGYLEYRPPAGATVAGSGGRIYARLARLRLTPASSQEVEALLEEQPAAMPALDIVVDDFVLRSRSLGRLEVEAINRAAAGVREWRLNKFNLNLPEATLTASGNWARLNAQAAAASPGSRPSEARRTVLNFKLDMRDGGALLTRFGMKDVIRRASGQMQGQVAWVGTPFQPDYPTLGGSFTVNVASGQFLKAEPGLAKLLGVLSLQALPRRLTLDFRDVFSEGFAFDFLRGDVTLDKGIARTNNLQMKGVNAAVLMEGSADIARETQDLKVVVVPEINAGTASLIATVINPAVGLGSFLAQMFLRRPLIASATQEFHIDGSWADPQVVKIVKPPPANAPLQETKP